MDWKLVAWVLSRIATWDHSPFAGVLPHIQRRYRQRGACPYTNPCPVCPPRRLLEYQTCFLQVVIPRDSDITYDSQFGNTFCVTAIDSPDDYIDLIPILWLEVLQAVVGLECHDCMSNVRAFEADSSETAANPASGSRLENLFGEMAAHISRIAGGRLPVFSPPRSDICEEALREQEQRIHQRRKVDWFIERRLAPGAPPGAEMLVVVDATHPIVWARGNKFTAHASIPLPSKLPHSSSMDVSKQGEG